MRLPKSSTTKPDFAEAYNNMGNALQRQGKLQEAIEAYGKALSFKPDYPEAYNNIIMSPGKIQETIEAYSNALSLNNDYPEATII